jgi:hypothetical protein
MSDDPPSPPTELPTELVSTLDGCTPDQLRRAAHYSEELAEYKARRGHTDQAVDKAVNCSGVKPRSFFPWIGQTHPTHPRSDGL